MLSQLLEMAYRLSVLGESCSLLLINLGGNSWIFSWGKMCLVNENRINLKIEAFSPEVPRKKYSLTELSRRARLVMQIGCRSASGGHLLGRLYRDLVG